MTSPANSPSNWRWARDTRTGGQAVIFDIDGVLANADERQHFIAGAECDWRAFFTACSQDTVIEESRRLLELMGDDVTVILLTGRPIATQDLTVEWLDENDLHWDLLIMREFGTYDSSLIFKEAQVKVLKEQFDVRLAFEDDQRNRAMLQNEGVPCMYIHSGYYAERDAAAAAGTANDEAATA